MLPSLVLMFSIFTIQQTYAQSVHHDMGRSNARSNAQSQSLSPKDLRSRFELVGKIYITDSEGRLLSQGQEERKWRFGPTGDLVSNWSYQEPNTKGLAIRHTWTVSNEGVIKAYLQQFESMKHSDKKQDIPFGKLIREEKIEVKDFAPITWVIPSDSKQQWVVRFSPELSDPVESLKVGELPITLSNLVVFDNRGRLWAQGENLEGRYLAMKTHQGQFAVSYAPFKGASEMGTVQGNVMSLQVANDLKITVKSDRPILTTTYPVKVYGKVDLSKRSDRLNSVRASASWTEKSFLAQIE